MADMNTNLSRSTSTLVSTERPVSASSEDRDSLVGHVSGKSVAPHEKVAPPEPTARGTALVTKFSSKTESHKTGSPLRQFMIKHDASTKVNGESETLPSDTKRAAPNALRAFMSNLAGSISTTEDSDVDEVLSESGSVTDQDDTKATNLDGTYSGVGPEPLGTLGKGKRLRDDLQRKIEDLEAKQVKDEALNGPPVFALSSGVEIRGALARQFKAIQDAMPENIFKSMGGVSAHPSVKQRVEDIDATPEKPERLPHKPVIDIPGRDKSAFEAAKARFAGTGNHIAPVDQQK